MRVEVKDFRGKIIGFVDEKYNGDKEVFDEYGRRLGFYDKATDYTKDRGGRLIAKGDQTSMLIAMKNQ